MIARRSLVKAAYNEVTTNYAVFWVFTVTDKISKAG